MKSKYNWEESDLIITRVGDSVDKSKDSLKENESTDSYISDKEK